MSLRGAKRRGNPVFFLNFPGFFASSEWTVLNTKWNFTFKYYNNTQVEPLLFAPNELAHFSGTALLSPENIIKDFNQPKKDDIVWTINTTGFGNYQPEMPTHWIKQKEKGFEDAHYYQGWIIVTKYKIE